MIHDIINIINILFPINIVSISKYHYLKTIRKSLKIIRIRKSVVHTSASAHDITLDALVLTRGQCVLVGVVARVCLQHVISTIAVRLET